MAQLLDDMWGRHPACRSCRFGGCRMHRRLAIALALTLVTCALAQEDLITPAPATSDPVSFPAAGEDAPMLQGELAIPSRPEAEFTVPGVVLCHPDPRMGGTMDNTVVLEVREQLLTLGIAVLRFNFRGTGQSGGEHRDGVTEPLDVLGALAFLRAQEAVDSDRVALAGYSFGSKMAATAAARVKDVAAVACVGFPTGHEAVTFEDWQFLADVKQPILFVSGTEDRYSSIPNIITLRDHHELDARILPIEGANHFFMDAGKRAMMGIQVAQFLSMKLVGQL
ncbi:MAG: prolyl oligopeptidase family serine peptidase [Armatimonadia bacterium]|nr:prolyl oligopeptidase family serine peptidase [Armatimonadia bacterium]